MEEGALMARSEDVSDPEVRSSPTSEQRRKSFFGIRTFEHLAILMVGFSGQNELLEQLCLHIRCLPAEGLTHLASLATFYLFKDDLKYSALPTFPSTVLSPSQVSLLLVAPAFPWFLKPVFAFYSDSYPLFGKRRKPYLIFFSFLQALGYVLLTFTVNGIIGAVLALFLIAFSAAFCSAIADALVVEATSGSRREASETVADFATAKAVGSLTVAYSSGHLLELVSKQTVFLLTALFPLMITVTAFLMTDTSTSPHLTVARQVEALVTFLQQRLIWGPCMFILAFVCGPDYDDALYFYYTNVLGFGYSFMGTLKFTYGFATIAGTLLYRYQLHEASYRRLLWMSILVSLPIYICKTLTYTTVYMSACLAPLLLITGANLKLDEVFVLSGAFLNEAVAEIQLLPLLALTTRICPAGLEGSAYSTMLAVKYLGSAVSKGTSALSMSALGITASKFDKLTNFVWICGLFNLLPFIFIGLIPSDEEIDRAGRQKIKSASLSMKFLTDRGGGGEDTPQRPPSSRRRLMDENTALLYQA